MILAVLVFCELLLHFFFYFRCVLVAFAAFYYLLLLLFLICLAGHPANVELPAAATL